MTNKNKSNSNTVFKYLGLVLLGCALTDSTLADSRSSAFTENNKVIQVQKESSDVAKSGDVRIDLAFKSTSPDDLAVLAAHPWRNNPYSYWRGWYVTKRAVC